MVLRPSDVNDVKDSSTAPSSGLSASVDLPVAEVCRCPDGIIEIRIREGAVVGVREMERILAAQLSIMQGPSLVLVDARGVRSMTREAQEFITGTAAERKTRAVAILIHSPVSALLGNFFLALARPVYPTRLFRQPEDARAWLLAR